MTDSEKILAELIAIGERNATPEQRIAAADARLEAMRAELDEWAASEPADTEVLRNEGADLPDRIRSTLVEGGNVSGPVREVLEHALAMLERWEQEASKASVL